MSTPPTRNRAQIVGGMRALDASTSTGPGETFELGGAYEKVAVQHQVTGTTADASIQVQGRIGGATVWVDLGTPIVPSTAGAITVASSTVPVTDVRINVATAAASTGGITAWVAVL